MNKEGKHIVLCCQCGGHFDREEMKKMRIGAIKHDFYICNPCLERVPKLSEHIVKPLKKI